MTVNFQKKFGTKSSSAAQKCVGCFLAQIVIFSELPSKLGVHYEDAALLRKLSKELEKLMTSKKFSGSKIKFSQAFNSFFEKSSH